MRILLVGEYSRLHNSLKEGLLQLGKEVVLVGTGDGYKDYPNDLSYEALFFKKTLPLFITKVILSVFRINLIKIEYAFRFYQLLPKLKNFCIVQLINENSIKTYPFLERYLIKKLVSQNGKLFLLSCGTDYSSVKYAFEKKYKYSILSPYFEDKSLKKHYKYVLQYINPQYKRLHQKISGLCTGIIASDLDYHLPLLGEKKYIGLIPNPINHNKLTYQKPQLKGKILIFHGISSSNYIKKGNVFFDDALKIIANRYPKKIKIIRTVDIPYNKYIELYNQCHILMDQVYAYDQGYNALEAMAKGKVVFTGAEKIWLEYFKIQEDCVAINALPSSEQIVRKLEYLIQNPNKILEISKAAREFILREHDYLKISQAYLNIWNKN